MSLELETITNYEKVSTMNANFEAIVEEFLNKLDRVSSEDGNAMEQDLDMNGYTILNAVIDDSTLQETFDSFLEQAESDIDDYVVETAFPQIDAYSTEVVDTYVTDTVKPEIDTYVVDVSEATIDDYVENTSKPSLDTYVEDTLQPELEAFCTLAEQWASEDEDVLVDGTDYSAKHYAAKASASASSASTSATEAADSATEATDIVTALQEDSSFTLTGDATGTGTMDASYQVSIAVDVNSADNATTADALSSAITVELDGDVTGSASTDGSSDVTITTTLDASAIGSLSVPYPDLHIPFNDGLRIESGYGTNDQIDVSAAQDGSVMVDLPSKSTDFTRSTGYYYINKSGLIDYADIDEPAITSDGVLLHGSMTNYLRSSDDVSNETYWANNQDVTYGAVDNGLGIDLIKVIPTSSGTTPLLKQARTTSTELETTLSFYGKKSDEITTIRVYIRENENDYRVTQNINIQTGEIGVSQEIGGATINDFIYQSYGEYFRITLNCTLVNTDRLNTQALIYFIDDSFLYDTSPSFYTGNDSDGLSLGGFDLWSGHYSLPLHIQTTTDASTITATTCTVPVENNMPAAGESFTIVCDANIPPYDGATLLSSQSGNNQTNCARFTDNGNLIFRVGDGTTVVTPTWNYEEGDSLARYVLVFNSEDDTLTAYKDGALSTHADAIVDTSSLDWKNVYLVNDEYLTLGNRLTLGYLNSTLKNFKIYRKALTAEQVAALGVAE